MSTQTKLTYEQRHEKIVELQKEYDRLEKELQATGKDGAYFVCANWPGFAIQMEIYDLGVWIEGNYISLYTGNINYEYYFEHSRCNTLEKILHWVLHLNHKRWMTPDLTCRFIEVACSHYKLNPY